MQPTMQSAGQPGSGLFCTVPNVSNEDAGPLGKRSPGTDEQSTRNSPLAHVRETAGELLKQSLDQTGSFRASEQWISLSGSLLL